ncbi:MAG TPA: Uma2 family endonuclease [Blastocatellia bacterium]|nr:Uma2 family endonuclease [Blastocatellia bacterium]
MATAVSQPEQRVVLYDVSWATYEHLLADHFDCSSPRFTYDEGTLEIMSPSGKHEKTNRVIATLVESVADEWEIDLVNFGSTTFKREDFKKGFEPDSCFYIQNVESVRDKDEIDLHSDPPPDLVIEIDITSGSLHKLPIYAALGIPEVWRFTGERLLILALQDGAYVEADESLALPGLTGEIIIRFVEDRRRLKRPTWIKSIREWARSHRPA